MPRQRKPNINPSLVDQALGRPVPTGGMLMSLVQKSLETNKRTKKQDDIISRGDITKRPMLPEEVDRVTQSSPNTSIQESSPTKERERIHGLTQRKKSPLWFLDIARSRLMRDKSEFEGKPDELSLRKKEEETNKSEVQSLYHQTHEIRSYNHPESCACGKSGGCASRQNEKGTTKLPVGISKEEESSWVGEEASRRGISKDEMNSWYQEQKNPKPIRIAPDSVPEGHHPLLSQFDHDPREQCHDHGRNPIGHVGTVWNQDGAITGFPRGVHNIGLVVGVASRGTGEGTKSLTPEVIDAHHEKCSNMPVGIHSEECPIGFHDKNCRGGEHASGCKIPENTITSGSHEGETLYKVIPWTAAKTEDIQKRHRSKIDFNSLNGPSPEWTTSGIRGLQGGTTIPASRFIHVPDEATEGFLSSADRQGKANAKEHFGNLEGIVGDRSALLTKPTFFENPLGFPKYEQNKSLPGFAAVADQLENPSKIGEEGLKSSPEGFVRGRPTEKPKTESESVLDNIMNKEEPKTSKKLSYTHVNESYEPSPSCRFCEDASHKDGKSKIMQTSVSPDGRPLYAHEECDNPFAFADKFNFEFEGPSQVDADFISMASHNWGMGNQPGAQRVNRELGIVTPSKPSNLVDPGVPGNTKKINSMGLPEHKAAEQQGDPDELAATETEVNNLNSNGTAKPPK
jgi:hypothetical protein